MGIFRWLINDFKRRVIHNQKGFLLTASALSALPYAIAGLGAAGGIAGSLGAFGGKKKKAQFGQFDPQAAERERLMQELRGLVSQETPKIFQRGQDFFDQQLTPQILERNQAIQGKQPGSTAETVQLGQAGANLTRQLSDQALRLKLAALSGQAGLLQDPTRTVEQPGASFGQNLLSFGAPIASSFFQNQGQAALLKQLLGPSAGDDIAPDDLNLFFNKGNDFSQAFGKSRADFTNFTD